MYSFPIEGKKKPYQFEILLALRHVFLVRKQTESRLVKIIFCMTWIFVKPCVGMYVSDTAMQL